MCKQIPLLLKLGKIIGLEGIDFDLQYQHFPCFPNILNLAVKDIKIDKCGFR